LPNDLKHNALLYTEASRMCRYLGCVGRFPGGTPFTPVLNLPGLRGSEETIEPTNLPLRFSVCGQQCIWGDPYGNGRRWCVRHAGNEAGWRRDHCGRRIDMLLPACRKRQSGSANRARLCLSAIFRASLSTWRGEEAQVSGAFRPSSFSLLGLSCSVIPSKA
jgi:hypothetical protein